MECFVIFCVLCCSEAPVLCLDAAGKIYEWLPRPVVVLAEKDKEDMDRQLRLALKGYTVEWHTRMGAPHNLSDLARVAAGQAKTIILLDPEDGEVCVYAFVCACVRGSCMCTCVHYHRTCRQDRCGACLESTVL